MVFPCFFGVWLGFTSKQEPVVERSRFLSMIKLFSRDTEGVSSFGALFLLGPRFLCWDSAPQYKAKAAQSSFAPSRGERTCTRFPTVFPWEQSIGGCAVARLHSCVFAMSATPCFAPCAMRHACASQGHAGCLELAEFAFARDEQCSGCTALG